ncbi:hypothetical protein V8F06_005959 [Rhypophila decipiens]
MAPKCDWDVKVSRHPRSSAHEIDHEPDFHQHKSDSIGLSNRQDSYEAEIARAGQQLDELQKEIAACRLVTFRDLIQHQKDFHLEHPENRSLGWRYVLNASQDWVKTRQNWPANEKPKRKEQKSASLALLKEQRSSGTGREADIENLQRTKNANLQQLSLLRSLEHERKYISQLQQDDGTRKSPPDPQQVNHNH